MQVLAGLREGLTRLMPRRLSGRVFWLYGVTLLVFFSGGLALFLAAQYEELVEEKQQSGVMIIELAAQTVRDSAVIGDYDTLRRTLEVAVQGSIFARASFLDLAGGRVEAVSLDKPRADAPAWFSAWVSSKFYDVNLAITVGGKDYGVLRLTYDSTYVAGDLWSLTLIALLGAVGSLLLGLVPIQLLLRRWLGGLDRVREYERAMAAGTLDASRLGIKGAPQEIQSVIDVFRRTAELIRERETGRRALDNQKFALDQHAIVSMTDLEGRITYANDRFCEITGYTREELIGQNHRLINSGMQPPAFFENLWQTISSGQVWRGEICNRNRKGEPYWVSATLVPLMGADGRPEQYIAIRTDITRRKAAEASLQGAKEAAEQANLAKSQFLANMSHEIRTPLNAVLGMLKLLQSTPLTSRQDDYVTKTEGAARSLMVLLNDILDFSKIEADKLTLDARPFRIDQMLRDLSVILSASVGYRPLEVLFDVDPDLPRTLVGDDMRLRQVLINLGGNAIKFTEKGEVVIGVRVQAATDDAVTLRLSVRDTGIGISEEQQARIFSGFSQAETSTTRRFGGTGLGLAISRRLVEMMGGRLEVDSQAGQGSNFHFTVRLPRANDQPEGSDLRAASQRQQQDLSSLRALVVDDNPTARDLLCTMVRSLGWQADAAETGQQALAMSREQAQAGQPYDVAFVDWQMPGMDGWETSLRLRDSGGRSPTTVMMVTAHGREMLSQRSAAEQAALGGFLVKPVTASMLLDAVADARLGAAAAPPAPRPPSARRLQGLHLLVVEDNPNNQQVAQELLEAEGARVALADNGEAGVKAVLEAAPPFDAVLMDLQMPVMDGYTATARIREHAQHATLPIIAMTANALTADRDACLAAGMNDHVGKPFELGDLVAAIRRHTVGSAASAEADPPAWVGLDADVREAALRSGIDAEAAARRLEGNLTVYGRMLRTFLDDLPGQMQRLQDDVLQGRWREAAALAHTLKGLAGMVGASPLQQAAATAEKAFDGLRDATPAPTTGEVPEAQAALAPMQAQAQALASAQEWARTLGVEPRPPADALSAGQLHERLEAMLEALRRSDMRAVELFEALRHVPDLKRHTVFGELEAAIDSLDFERAMRLGTRLSAEVSTA